jgi:hypothetical protein
MRNSIDNIYVCACVRVCMYIYVLYIKVVAIVAIVAITPLTMSKTHFFTATATKLQ